MRWPLLKINRPIFCYAWRHLYFYDEDTVMALKATIYKADLNIANMDTHQYSDHQLTLALHPSETIERLMVRIAVLLGLLMTSLSLPKTCLRPMSQPCGKRT